MKNTLIISTMLCIVSGCVTPTPDNSDFGKKELESCLFEKIKKCNFHESDNDEWLRVRKNILEFGYVGKTNAQIQAVHESCDPEKGCRFKRIGLGRPGYYYLWRRSDNEVEFGKLNNENLFEPVIFKY